MSDTIFVLFGHPRLLLAATEMRLAHPVSGQALRLQAGLAEDFAEVIGRLGWGEVCCWAGKQTPTLTTT